MFKVIFERDPNKQGNFSMSMLNPFLMFLWFALLIFQVKENRFYLHKDRCYKCDFLKYMKTSAKKLHYPCYLLLIFDDVEMNYLEAFTVSLIITSILEVRVFLVCKNKMKQISTCYHWVSANSHTRKKTIFCVANPFD